MIKNEFEKVKKIENNDTLLISEIQDKVVLPYTSNEIEELLNCEESNFKSPEEVIINKYTKPLSYYKFQFLSRYNETINLISKSDESKSLYTLTLPVEMMFKRYLHPAIISACRNLDELNVYLDCLEKNELDDFKIFNIKYEIHPIIAKENDDNFENTTKFSKILKLIKKSPNKNNVKKEDV